MIPKEKFIIFKSPKFDDEFSNRIADNYRCKFASKSANRKLVNDILIHNGCSNTVSDDFVLFWGTSYDVDSLSRKSRLQVVNHFPNSKHLLGNKAELAKIIQLHPLYNRVEQFLPKTYVLPNDHAELFHRMKMKMASSFISKPPMGSCGCGIKIVSFKDFYSIPQGSVVSDYIAKPLLIDGFKFDMRIYVLVTSFCPMRAFIYKEGLARFATESYSRSSTNAFSTLTNATLNKKHSKWCSEFKWKLSELLSELEKRWKKTSSELMNNIIDVVAKALVFIQPSMSKNDCYGLPNSSFELYGFDILIDQDFKMWLLEINTMPSLGTDEDTDFDVKAPLIAQALSIVGIPSMDLAELRTIETAPYGKEIMMERHIIDEDERNVLSGGGFIRIFPSQITNEYQKYLIVPCKTSNVNIERIIDDPTQYGKYLTQSQGYVVLIHILSKIDISLNKNIDPRVISRLLCFLSAQGYHVNTSNVRSYIKHYIVRLNKWITESKEQYIIESEKRNKIMSSDGDYIRKLLESCNMAKVKSVSLLFP